MTRRVDPPSPRSRPPWVTISVVSHGSGAALNALLESIARWEAEEKLQLIVTDNLGDLGDLPAARWHSLEILRPEKPRGYAFNHNEAFKHARGNFFCVLNPDVLFVQGTIAPLARRLESGEAGIIAPVVTDSAGTLQDSFRALPSPAEIIRRRVIGRAPVTLQPGTRTLDPDWVAGLFMLMKRQTFDELGGFDARYHLYFEDVDLCTRARLKGLRVLVDARVRIQHDAQRASRLDLQYLLWHIQSAVRFFASPVYGRARKISAHA